MSPQEHLDKAEGLITGVRENGQVWESEESMLALLASIAHALIAIGDLLGAPHSGPATGVPSAAPG